MIKNRVLWILNHETLSEFELPLINDLGFEILTPKKVPKAILQSSGSITYKYDSTLTIPLEDIQTLNEYNFFEDKEMPFNISYLINKYFDIAIVMFDFYALNKIVESFNGYIFARAFGVGKDTTYYDLTKLVFNEEYFYKLDKIKDRFWFSCCYENIPDIEKGIYKEKAIYMPLGLPDSFYGIANQWYGELDKILFFCTRINLSTESRDIYEKFKRDFKGFDYIVAGNQPVPVDDEKVIGFLERESLNDLYKECKLMFYHSTLPRHLHYHPLEAMIAGMPVIYLKGGALSVLGGQRQTGCCKDISEARSMAKRIFAGDKKLIEDIIHDQKEILHKFTYEYNKKIWEENFLNVFVNVQPRVFEKSKLVSVFISSSKLEQHKSDYIEMFKVINSGIKEVFQQNRLLVNVQKDAFNIEEEYSDLLENEIAVGEYGLETVTADKLSDIFTLMFKRFPIRHNEYLMPVNNVSNFVDSDYWLFIDDDIDKPIAPIKPYGLYIEDLSIRNYEAISSTKIANIKNSSFIVTMIEQTKIDLIMHLGVNKNKIIVIPFIHSIPKLSYNIEFTESFILIEVDLNHRIQINKLLDDILDCLSAYDFKHEIMINCNNYKKGINEGVYNTIKRFVETYEVLRKKVVLNTNMSESKLEFLYAKAIKIIIPFYIENIFFKVKKASYLSKKIFLNDFPIYRNFANEHNIGIEFKKFNLKSNFIHEILIEESNDKRSNYKEVKRITSNDIVKMSEAWRTLL